MGYGALFAGLGVVGYNFFRLILFSTPALSRDDRYYGLLNDTGEIIRIAGATILAAVLVISFLYLTFRTRKQRITVDDAKLSANNRAFALKDINSIGKKRVVNAPQKKNGYVYIVYGAQEIHVLNNLSEHELNIAYDAFAKTLSKHGCTFSG